VRVTVNELLGMPSGERLDRPEPVPSVVDPETYLMLVTVANALGELVARASAERRYPAEQEASPVYEQVRQAVVEIRSAIAAATARAWRRR
jgi:Na+-transporting methylmalonyl-CoA/oxaloacetate decarboxylase gamma subunit